MALFFINEIAAKAHFCQLHNVKLSLSEWKQRQKKPQYFKKSWQSISMLYFGCYRHRPIKINHDPPERKDGNETVLLSNRMYWTIEKRMFSSIKKLNRKIHQFNSDFNSFDQSNSGLDKIWIINKQKKTKRTKYKILSHLIYGVIRFHFVLNKTR